MKKVCLRVLCFMHQVCLSINLAYCAADSKSQCNVVSSLDETKWAHRVCTRMFIGVHWKTCFISHQTGIVPLPLNSNFYEEVPAILFTSSYSKYFHNYLFTFMPWFSIIDDSPTTTTNKYTLFWIFLI